MIVPASPLIFDAEDQPRSRLYDDVYFSRDDGLAETRAVFLAGCGLPDRWKGRRRFCVAELGFGVGLNVAALLDLWRAEGLAGAHLSIFSVDAHPVLAAEAARVLARWPALASIAQLLTARWPGRRPGFHRVDLPELGATLDVAVMDAAQALEAWGGAADAWFLDGFAPSRNPAMWTPALMAAVAARSAPGAMAATYTVAGEVRRNLAAAGFEIARRPGFGRKRERLEARLPGSPAVEPPAPRVAIVGAGIAGASLARAFAALGAATTVFDVAGVGAGASGNPAALVTPGLDAGHGPAARLHAAGFARATDLYGRLEGAVLARGALQLEGQARDGARFARIAAGDLFEPAAVQPLEADETAARMGEAAPAGLYLVGALTVRPATILGAWIGEPGVARIARVEAETAGGWRLIDPEEREVARANVVCLAAGMGLTDLWAGTFVRPVRGQLSWAEGALAPASAAWGAYVAPAPDGMMFGATHDRGDADADWREEDDRRNLAELAKRFPRLAAEAGGRAIHGRASVRATTPDSLPLAGWLAPGLLVLGGLGSRGFSLAPLLADHLAALALGALSPLPSPLARLVDPGRFAERARRKASSNTAHPGESRDPGGSRPHS